MKRRSNTQHLYLKLTKETPQAFYSNPNVKFTLGVIFFAIFVLLQTCFVLSIFDAKVGNTGYKVCSVNNYIAVS